MEQKRESMMNVPVDEDTKAFLKAQAEANGRAACREAAQILKDAAKASREAAL